MSKPVHERLLEEGAQTAPEPATAEARSAKLGKRSPGGIALGSGAAAVKFGGVTKLAAFLFAFHGFAVGWIGGWIAIALIAAVSLGVHYLRTRGA